ERLGAGGMSEVWRGYDEVLGRPVAVKMLCGRYAADAATRSAIRVEARAAARLSHPHVTNVYDYGETVAADGTRTPFVVMEFLDGGLPWHADTVTGMIAANCSAEPAPLPPIDGLPAEVAEVCARCLAKAPEERPTSAEVARVLATAAGVPLPLPEHPADAARPDAEPTTFLAIGTTLGLITAARAGRAAVPAPGRARRRVRPPLPAALGAV